MNQIHLASSHIDSIAKALNSEKKQEAIRHYELSRKAFKQVEFYLEYHFPFHSKYFINSALVNKAELEYRFKTFAPHGFQVIETYLYKTTEDTTIQVKHELELLKQSFEHLKEKTPTKSNKEATAIDMLRFEIVRIMSLYLNGYDCTVNKQNLKEVIYILEGIEKTISLLDAELKNKSAFSQLIQRSKSYLSKNNNYDTFNRLFFITNYLKPLYENLHALYPPPDARANTLYGIHIRQQKFYSKGWLNTKYFSVVLNDSALVNEQAAIGKLLFFDPILSDNNQRACASCHQPNNAFGGSIDFNADYNAEKKLTRNTPPLVNAMLQKSFFYDGRSLQLEDQASDVLLNHKEMNARPEELVRKLRLSAEYKAYFKKAFLNTEDTAITYYAVLKCISEYERKLTTLNSRFDNYVRGDKKQLSTNEINGYNIFAGKALCGTCHFFPLFNGLVPPFYSDNEFEVIGVPKTKQNKEISADSGRYLISKNPIHLHAFKTPGIRNIERTAPYMHNAVFTNLDEIIIFYQKGGGGGLGLNIPNQTLPFDSLVLTKNEVKQLKQFLLCLSDSSFNSKPPQKLPFVKGYEKRKVGGEY